MKKRVILVSIGIFVLAGVIVGISLFNKPHRNVLSEKPFANLSSVQLFDKLSNGDSTQTANLIEKTLEVKGKVIDIIPNPDSTTTLVLASNDPIFGVKCMMLHAKDLMNIHAGSSVTVRGICTGFNSDVEMVRCVRVDDKNI